MKFDEKHIAIIMQRVLESKDECEHIYLVSKIDKRRIRIHRVILMTTIEYFADLLRANGLNAKPNEFVLNTSGKAIKTVVDFCYTGHISLTEQNVENCLKIAVDGKIDLLLSKCNDYYSKKLRDEHVVEVLSIADKYNLKDLQRRASERFCSHVEEMPAFHFQQLNATMMVNLMENANKITSEALLVNRLLSWFRYEEAGRSESMPELLRLIRLEKLAPEFLCGTIKPIFKQFKCIALLNNEFKRRASFDCSAAKDDSAATSDKTAIVYVTVKSCIDNITTSSQPKYIVTVERFDESLNEFTTYITFRTDSGGSIIHLYGDKMFRINGCGDNFMFAFDLKTGKEEKLHPMNVRRSSFGSVLMGKSIYVFGGYGYSKTNEILNSCESYDTETGTWQIMKPMNHQCRFASVAVLDGQIYVVAGYEHARTTSAMVMSYDPKTDAWRERKALDVNAVTSRTIATFNGMLYAFFDRYPVMEYDPVKNVWTKFPKQTWFPKIISANGSLFAITTDGSFGEVTINQLERKVDFIKYTEDKLPHSKGLSIQQCAI